MARLRSEGRRDAIVAAAIRLIAARGLSTPTAAIAKEAGVSNGSLFTYFGTKADLLNTVYVELKAEMAEAALDGVSEDADVREQMRHAWSGWLGWATSDPDKRRTLAQLDVSDEITPASHASARKAMVGIAAMLERCRAHGAMREASTSFVVALMGAVADTTIDFMVQDPVGTATHRDAGFDALWRIVG